jgi:hypothetical protein
MKKTDRKPDWEVALSVVCPKIKRPRRTSLHTLATILGRKAILALAKELQASDKVVGYRCPDVQCLIFYLKDMTKCPGMIDTRDAKVWEKVEPFCKENPLTKVKGFKRFAQGTWSGGSYGVGTYEKGSSAMSVPYEPDDFEYALKVCEALEDAGYTPGIEVKKVKGKLTCIVKNEDE